MDNHHCDTKFESATVVDGTGAPAYVADVAITGDRIVALGDLKQWQAKSSIDANKKVLAPGFIDAHTHDDRALINTPDMTAKVSQGVTTVVTGNCGISLAPLDAREPAPPLNLLGERSEWLYPDFDAYAERLDKTPAAINSVMLTGHSTLRVQHMDTLDRAARPAEIDAMAQTLAQSLASGSIGMSTGLAYPTASAAPTEEVIELGRVLHDFGRLHTTHMRDEETRLLESVEETIRIGREADIATVISHHKVCGRDNWGRTRDSLKLIAEAQQQQTLDLDVYPYTASSTVLLAQFVDRADRVMITWSKSLPEFNTRDLADVAKELNCDLPTAIEKLQPAGAIYFQMGDADLERVLAFPGAMIGSDGLPHDDHPHPRLWGSFSRVLGHYSRELGLFSLEEAVHRMTGKSAGVFGLVDRGCVKPGSFADIVLFDPDQIIDTANFEQPVSASKGIDLVMVNGETVYADVQVTDNRPGRLLRA